MAGTPQYVDISAFQPINIDWHTYRQWAKQWDGISRVAMRSSFGTGYTDIHFPTYRREALANGIDIIIYYHYGYPQYTANARSEADWQEVVLGQIRPQDMLMLDMEEYSVQANSQWAYQWLKRQKCNYDYTDALPMIYANDSYIRSRLQDIRLAEYPLALANWTFNSNNRPPCPPPWDRYEFLQYTDRAMIPGINGLVDANIYLGGAE